MAEIKFSEAHLAGLDLLIAQKHADPKVFGDVAKAVVDHAQQAADVVVAVAQVAAAIGATADVSDAALNALPKRSISLEDLLKLRQEALKNTFISTKK